MTIDPAIAAPSTPTRSWSRLRHPPGVIAAGLVVALLVLAVVWPSLPATHDPNAIDLPAALQSPSVHHLFGTDLSGRDLYSRVVHGTAQSLLIGIGATAVALLIAVVLGFSAGLAPRGVSAGTDRLIEVLFAFPALLLALLLVSVFGPGAATLVVAVGVGTAPGYARIIRGQVRSVRTAPYIEAARALGHTRTRIFRQHIVPNALRPMAVTATLGVGQSIVWASGLAFLGLGVPPPASEWGALLDAGRTYLTHAWWLELFPGLAIVVVALALTTLGRYAGHRLEGTVR